MVFLILFNSTKSFHFRGSSKRVMESLPFLLDFFKASSALSAMDGTGSPGLLMLIPDEIVISLLPQTYSLKEVLRNKAKSIILFHGPIRKRSSPPAKTVYIF